MTLTKSDLENQFREIINLIRARINLCNSSTKNIDDTKFIIEMQMTKEEVAKFKELKQLHVVKNTEIFRLYEFSLKILEAKYNLLENKERIIKEELENIRKIVDNFNNEYIEKKLNITTEIKEINEDKIRAIRDKMLKYVKKITLNYPLSDFKKRIAPFYRKCKKHGGDIYVTLLENILKEYNLPLLTEKEKEETFGISLEEIQVVEQDD